MLVRKVKFLTKNFARNLILLISGNKNRLFSGQKLDRLFLIRAYLARGLRSTPMGKIGVWADVFQHQVCAENTGQCLPLGDRQAEKRSRVSLDATSRWLSKYRMLIVSRERGPRGLSRPLRKSVGVCLETLLKHRTAAEQRALLFARHKTGSERASERARALPRTFSAAQWNARVTATRWTSGKSE